MRKNILIMGMPGSGKSTLLKKIISDYPNKVGFVTSEIRKEGLRTGFEIETNIGKKSLLASVDFKTGPKVSKYVVNITNLDILIPTVSGFSEDDLLYLDEIGQMELFSEEFKKLALNYLNSKNICICTLSKVFQNKFIDDIKSMKNIILVEITPENRLEKKIFVTGLVKKIFKAKRYLSELERFEKMDDKIILHSEHGVRTITKENGYLSCTCDFYKKYSICSHIIAAEELFYRGSLNLT